ncbi:MAG: beta-ketoacyl-ACP synthase II [Planctomycetota bacterium]|jgi:3-oxoacyl-[acyl-carrier-protein] synthase II
MRRIVVTGIGAIAPTGNCAHDAWQAAVAGRSAVRTISQFDPSDLPVQIAAEVRGFDPTTVLSQKDARQSSRFVQFAAAAANEAVESSGLHLSEGSDRHGCAIGVGIGAFGDIEGGAHVYSQKGMRKLSPLLLPYTIPNMAAGFVSAKHGLKGPSFCVATACASGTHAIGEAFLRILSGTVDVMLAGGAEAAITPLSVACFARMRTLSTRNETPSQASRPFDLDRDGFVMGEGAAILVLEEYEHARRRGAPIYAEMVGYGLSCDAYHITSPPPDGTGAARCMKAALRSAGIRPEMVDYVNAHGTSTQANDSSESAALQTVLGEHANKTSISSTKGVTGHCLGAAGGIEAVYTVLAVYHSLIPPTVNYVTPDPACPLDYTPGAARERSIRYAISNSFGFGGQNACVVFKRFD